MKKIEKVLIALAFLMFSVSCKQAELEYYSASNTIIFEGVLQKTSNEYIPQDTASFSFGYVPFNIKDSLHYLSVFATGGPKNVDRPYEIEFSKNSTLQEGTDYELLNPQFVIKGGQVRDILVFKLLRTDRIKKDTLFLDVKLHANENFGTEMMTQSVGSEKNRKDKDFTKYHFIVDDIAGPPWFWDPKKNPGGLFIINYFGDFSAKKFQMMASRFSWDIDQITAEKYMPGASLLVAWAKSMQSYLNQMEADGNAVYEADGVTLMRMGKSIK